MLSFLEYQEESRVPDRDCGTCAIESIAAIVGKTPQEVWEDGAERYWMRNGGIRQAHIIAILRKVYNKKTKTRFDLIWSPHVPGENRKNRTMRMVLKDLDSNGTYLISTRNHAMAWVRGNLTDIADVGSRTRVLSIEEILN